LSPNGAQGRRTIYKFLQVSPYGVAQLCLPPGTTAQVHAHSDLPLPIVLLLLSTYLKYR